MEEKEKFLNTIKEVNDDERVLEDWMWEEHYRLKEIDERNTALQEGREEGIEDNKKEVIVKVNIKMYKKLKIKMYKKCNQLCICSETSESIFNLSFKR